MKKILLSIALCASVMAANASFQLCGIYLGEDANSSSILAQLNEIDGVEATGTISYTAATGVLTLENVTITDAASSDRLLVVYPGSHSTIRLIGTNVIKSTKDAYLNGVEVRCNPTDTLHITGEGSLEISVVKWIPFSMQGGCVSIDSTTVKATSEQMYYGFSYTSAQGSLVVNKSTVTTCNINTVKAIELNDCEIVQPVGAEVVLDGSYYVDKKGSKDDIVIKPIGVPTAIDNTIVGEKATKRIVSGQFVIEKNGKFYNAAGAEVK